MIKGAISVMGLALDRELQQHGIFSLSRADYKAIIARVVERSAELARALPEPGKDLERRPPSPRSASTASD